MSDAIRNGEPHEYRVSRREHRRHLHVPYSNGCLLPPGATLEHNGTGEAERVLPSQSDDTDAA